MATEETPTGEHTRDALVDLRRAASKLVHARQQFRRYPTSEAVHDYLKRTKEEFLVLHRKYLETATSDGILD